MKISNKIHKEEYNPYYKTYINKATDLDLIKGLKSNLESHTDFYSNIALEKHNYAYAEGKWTIKQILLHIIDTERIFAYRALRIARRDVTPLAGFEQDDYMLNSNIKERTLKSLIAEYRAVRHSTIALFESFTQADLLFIGQASGSPISVRAIGYIIMGHENHHNTVISERYL
ncbi:DinB family protein [uncultured Winogradskyella sp.]|uniref:DinB family protein n=1 Tax=uncultured Winogradskyella sp. TaxID=395353 RepID=UPI00261DD806|nr:DinB family protein [uncultured Winogradskyella sp.]